MILYNHESNSAIYQIIGIENNNSIFAIRAGKIYKKLLSTNFGTTYELTPQQQEYFHNNPNNVEFLESCIKEREVAFLSIPNSERLYDWLKAIVAVSIKRQDAIKNSLILNLSPSILEFNINETILI